MLDRLVAFAKQGKEIWGFLALVAGLGVSYGRLSSRLDTINKDVDKVDKTVKELRDHVDTRFDKVDDRFERAHRLVERRVGDSDQLVMGLRESVARLAVLEELRARPGRPVWRLPVSTSFNPGGQGQGQEPPPSPPDQPVTSVQDARQGFQDVVHRTLKVRPPADLPAF